VGDIVLVVWALKLSYYAPECNVGYAFVNFITVEDLLKFANAKLGIKW
jgi:RNA recognition motif 2